MKLQQEKPTSLIFLKKSRQIAACIKNDIIQFKNLIKLLSLSDCKIRTQLYLIFQKSRKIAACKNDIIYFKNLVKLQHVEMISFM